MNPVLVYVLAGFLAGTFAGTWKPFLGFHKGPPTQELTDAQAKLAEAQQNAKAALDAKDAAQKEERSKLEAQVRSAQQDNVGVVETLKRVPPENQTPEVKLAGALAQRIDFKLGAAIGKLPDSDRQAMLDLIEQALSGKQAEVDEANRKLAQRDADFKALTAQRDEIAAKIPVLEERARKAQETAQTAQLEVTSKTEEVKTWAIKKDEADKRAGSFFGAFATMRRWAFGIGGFALVVCGVALYLRSGLGSVGRALHPLQKELPPDVYAKLVASLDGSTDRLHQWLISTGRKAEAGLAAKLAQP